MRGQFDRRSVVVTKKLKPAKVLQLARRAARDCDASIEEDPTRDKGSHRLFHVRHRGTGDRLASFTLTGHNRELSWGVLRSIETQLAPMLGEKWMEEK